MKIGIMSMQRIRNYGSFLQSYALMKTLKNMGHDVEFVDYHIGKCKVENEVIDTDNNPFINKCYREFRKIGSNILGVLFVKQKKRLEIARKVKIYNDNFESFCYPLLGIDDEKNYLAEVDLLIIGSDEVFNCLQSNPEVGYSLELFGKDNKARKVITYAASFGNTTYERLEKYKIVNEIGKYLNDLDEISVRDMNSENIVHRIINRNCFKHLDPVFLYDYKQEMPVNIEMENYIVVYAYGNRIRGEEAKYIIQFARKHNKKIVCLGMYQEFCDEYIPAMPFEMLTYFSKADYVITDTFHGTVFSIKFNKKFAVFVRKTEENSYGNAEKISDLLNTFNLNNRKIVKGEEIEKILDMALDKQAINSKIDLERKRSKEYLETQCQF